MSTDIPDLWPTDLGNSNEPSPLAILNAQASLLTKKTQGIVEGQVSKFSFETDQYEEDNTRMRHSFDCVGPALGNYRVSLFAVTTHLDSVYPVEIKIFEKDEKPDSVMKANSFEEYIKMLSKVFSSQRVLTVVRSIIAHSNGVQGKGYKTKELDEEVPF